MLVALDQQLFPVGICQGFLVMIIYIGFEFILFEEEEIWFANNDKKKVKRVICSWIIKLIYNQESCIYIV